MARYKKPTLREQIEHNADVARGYSADRETLWRALLALRPLLPYAARETASVVLAKTARCGCGNRVSYDADTPAPYGLTCERCLST
jgi:hypothetical protein